MGCSIRRFLQDEAGHAPLGYAVVSVLVLGVVFTAVASRDLTREPVLDRYLQALHQARESRTQLTSAIQQ